MHEDDGLAWRVSPEVTERLDRIAALGIDDLMDVTSTPARDARAAAATEEEDADEEGTDLREDPAIGTGDVHVRSAFASVAEAEAEAEEKALFGGADESSAETTFFDEKKSSSEPPASETAAPSAPSARPPRRPPPPRPSETETPSPRPSEGTEGTASSAESLRKTRTRLVLIRARDEMFASDPSFKKRSVSELNAEAVSFLKDGDDVRCVGAFAKLFRKLLDNHLTHKDLHVCHSNRAAAYLNLGLYEEALWDARQCQRLAEQRFNRDRDANAVAPIFRKAHARKGFALLGMEMPRQAKCSFEAGLAMQPDCVECKRGLEEARARHPPEQQ
jgi:protein arginine N-methyltransferase 7